MPDLEIVNPIPVDECDAWSSSMLATFLDNPGPDTHTTGNERRRRGWIPERHWGVRSDGRWVSTLTTFPTTLSLPGGTEVATDALAMVTVAATHKRRGILTAMITDSLRSARERGEAISALHAAEWPIYGRFGYAPASMLIEYRLDPRLRGASVPQTETGARVRQVDAVELRAIGPAVFGAARRPRGGGIDRDELWWDATLGLGGLALDGPVPTYVVHDGPDGPDGYLAWIGDGKQHSARVLDLQAAGDDAYRGLWEYLTRLELIERLELPRRTPDEPARWLLTDGRALRTVQAFDGIWLRLLDVPAVLGARRYAVEGSVVLEVVDEQAGGFGAGRFRLDGGPDGASCAVTTESAQLRVDQRGLAAAVLGGNSLRSQLIAGRVDELVPGALDRADAMLRTPLAPWSATGF